MSIDWCPAESFVSSNQVLSFDAAGLVGDVLYSFWVFTTFIISTMELLD